MTPIQALNAPKSRHQQPFRVDVWAGRETSPGCRATWVIYATSIPSAIAKAVRAFRRGPGKGGRFSDWTVNLEPLRAGETIMPAEVTYRGVDRSAHRRSILRRYAAWRQHPSVQ